MQQAQSQPYICKEDFLENLTPAENYLLLENSKVTMKGLLKLTMLDLLLKRVIEMENVTVRADERSPERILTYVEAGINFQSYQPKTHEAIFLNNFQANLDNKILFKHLVKISHKKATSLRNFVYNQILTHSETSSLFNTRKMFAVVVLNDLGRQAKIQLQKDLSNLKFALIDDQSLLTRVNGNLFLVDIIDPEFLTKIDHGLDNREGGTSAIGKLNFPRYRDFYHSFSSDFDSSFDSAASSFGGFWFGEWGSDSLTG